MKFNSPYRTAAGILLVACSCLLFGCRNEMQRAWSEDVLRRHDFAERYEQVARPESLNIVAQAYTLQIDELANLTEKCLYLMRDSIEQNSPVDFNQERFKFLRSMTKMEVAFAMGLRPKTSEESSASGGSP